MKTYITFGQAHVHCIRGIIFDVNCVALITHDKQEDGRTLAFKIFGRKFCFEYPEEYFKLRDMHFYPRGIIEIDPYVVEYYQKEIDRERACDD